MHTRPEWRRRRFWTHEEYCCLSCHDLVLSNWVKWAKNMHRIRCVPEEKWVDDYSTFNGWRTITYKPKFVELSLRRVDSVEWAWWPFSGLHWHASCIHENTWRWLIWNSCHLHSSVVDAYRAGLLLLNNTEGTKNRVERSLGQLGVRYQQIPRREHTHSTPHRSTTETRRIANPRWCAKESRW